MQENNQDAKTMNSLYVKCWDDKAFKQELMANPVATIEKFTGKPVNLPEGKELVIVDQTDAKYLHLNIPAEPNMDELELTEEQLELVSGGVLPIILGIASAKWIIGGAIAGTAIGVVGTVAGHR